MLLTKRENGYDQGPILLTWININSSMDKQMHQLWNVARNYVPISKLQPRKLWSLGMGWYFISHLNDYVVINTCCDLVHISKTGPGDNGDLFEGASLISISWGYVLNIYVCKIDYNLFIYWFASCFSMMN